MFRFVHIILAAAMVAVAAPQASAIDLFNKDMIEPDKRVPACDDASVHRRIQRKFAHADREYYRGIRSGNWRWSPTGRARWYGAIAGRRC